MQSFHALEPKQSFHLLTREELIAHLPGAVACIERERLRWFARHQSLPELRDIGELLMIDARRTAVFDFLLENREAFERVAQTPRQSAFFPAFIDSLRKHWK